MSTEVIHPHALFESLKANATTRTRRSLEIIHRVCREQYERGSRDFSLPTIGPLSKAEGGPGEGAIRNKSGEHFKSLIATWAQFAEGSTRKQAQPSAPLAEEAVLTRIDDPVVRAVVGMVLAKNKKLIAENQLLKQHASVTIDLPKKGPPSRPTAAPPVPEVEVLSASTGPTKAQIQVLEQFVSPESLARLGWEESANGRLMKGALAITPPYWMEAYRALLALAKRARTPEREG